MDIAAFVEKSIKRLAIEAFVRNWNKGDGSKIGRFSHFLSALAMTRDLLAAYEAAESEAEALGFADFEGEMCRQLEDVITTTFLVGILREAEAWALETIEAGPLASRAPAPFANTRDWLNWVLANLHWPVSICGPYGEDVAADEAVAALLRQALRAARSEAVEHGWVLSDPIHALRGFLEV